MHSFTFPWAAPPGEPASPDQIERARRIGLHLPDDIGRRDAYHAIQHHLETHCYACHAPLAGPDAVTCSSPDCRDRTAASYECTIQRSGSTRFTAANRETGVHASAETAHEARAALYTALRARMDSGHALPRPQPGGLPPAERVIAPHEADPQTLAATLRAARALADSVDQEYGTDAPEFLWFLAAVRAWNAHPGDATAVADAFEASQFYCKAALVVRPGSEDRVDQVFWDLARRWRDEVEGDGLCRYPPPGDPLPVR